MEDARTAPRMTPTAAAALPTCTTFEARCFSVQQWYSCPMLKAKVVREAVPRPPKNCDLAGLGLRILQSFTLTPLALRRSTPTRDGRGLLLALDLDPQPTLENGYSAWHATRVTSLTGILSQGLLPGPSPPIGIYTFRDALKYKCWGRDYCPAVRCCPGVFMKMILHVSPSGLWRGHEPNVIRTDQWARRHQP